MSFEELVESCSLVAVGEALDGASDVFAMPRTNSRPSCSSRTAASQKRLRRSLSLNRGEFEALVLALLSIVFA